jgi:dienelactone hydrolase
MSRPTFVFMVPVVILVSLSLFSCSKQHEASPPAKPDDATSGLFSYDRTASIEVTIDTVRTLDSAVVRDGHFAASSPRHGQVKFYLVRPAGNGPFAGVLFFHWLGRPKGNREEFFDEAIQLAREGVVSLLVQGYFPWQEDPVNGPTDRQTVVDQTVDTRKALDLLIREPGVDPQRIAYVGHDYGAMFGAIVAGLESRVKTYVFIAGMGNFGDWSLKYWPATAAGGEKFYRDALDPVDPIRFVSHAAPAALLFQFSNNDKYISKETAMAFSGAASNPKTVRWYDADHDMSIPEVQKDRLDWLARHLGLTRP